jgi:hypothetical protein
METAGGYSLSLSIFWFVLATIQNINLDEFLNRFAANLGQFGAL